MIFTLTMNPSLDRYLYVDRLIEDDTVRVKKVEDYAAGKGIDVSRVIREVGGTSIAICPLGGETGEKMEFMLDNERVLYAAVRVKKETRMNVLVQTPASQYRMSMPGNELTDDELGMITDMIDAIVRTGDVLVVSGSLPAGLPPETYREIVKDAKAKGIKVYVDTDGKNLKEAVEERPDGIKPNIHELSRLLNRKLEIGDVPEAAKELNRLYGIEDILITLGKDGAIAYTGGKTYRIHPVDVMVVSAVGAGDSFLAGFVHKKGFPAEEALKFAEACGTAAVMTPGTTLCRKEDVERVEKLVRIEEI